MKTGIYQGISNEDYHAGPGISSSQIKRLLKSPAHYKYALDNKSDPTPAMLLGSLVHTMVQEPDKLCEEYIFVDVGSRAAKLYKQAVMDHPGLVVMLESEREKASAMALSAFANRDAVEILKGANIEHSIYWEEDGILCKCRPDIWQPDFGLVCDTKTCIDASPDGFSKAVVNFGYDVSAAWYLRGIRKATGKDPREWLWLCIEKSEPYVVQMYRADEELLRRGNWMIDKAMKVYRECLETDAWRGYGENEEIVTIGLPQWAAYFEGN